MKVSKNRITLTGDISVAQVINQVDSWFVPGPSVEIRRAGDSSGGSVISGQSAGRVILSPSGGRVITASRLYSGLEERHQFKSSPSNWPVIGFIVQSVCTISVRKWLFNGICYRLRNKSVSSSGFSTAAGSSTWTSSLFRPHTRSLSNYILRL